MVIILHVQALYEKYTKKNCVSVTGHYNKSESTVAPCKVRKTTETVSDRYSSQLASQLCSRPPLFMQMCYFGCGAVMHLNTVVTFVSTDTKLPAGQTTGSTLKTFKFLWSYDDQRNEAN